MRIAAYWLVKPSKTEEENIAQVERAVELASQFNATTAPDCRIVGIKVICDGIVDGCTAGLSEPYSHNNHTEVPLWTAEQLHPVVRRADAAGLQVALHAIGDATITMVVDVLESCTRRENRPRVEHIELASVVDAEAGEARHHRLDPASPRGPGHPARLATALGPHRCKRAFAYREFADHGAPSRSEATPRPPSTRR